MRLSIADAIVRVMFEDTHENTVNTHSRLCTLPLESHDPQCFGVSKDITTISDEELMRYDDLSDIDIHNIPVDRLLILHDVLYIVYESKTH